MRSTLFRGLALSLASLTVSLLAAKAAENTDRQGRLFEPKGEIRVREPVEANRDEVRADASSAMPSNSLRPSSVPTPAKRLSGSGVKVADVRGSGMDSAESAPKATSEKGNASESAPAKSSGDEGKPAEEPLHPIPTPGEGAPIAIEAASFKGITPGVSTKDEVASAWGEPKKTSEGSDSEIHLYTLEPFKQVEVSYRGDKVASIVIRLERAFPSDAVAKQLDLLSVHPVAVANELGEVLGLSYPERGVLFAVESGTESGRVQMNVTQIILEPITAEPFVLRAETLMESRLDLSRRDLERALKLEPDNARANWLQGRVLTAVEQHESAVEFARKAARLESSNPLYCLTYAQALAQVGQLSEAIQQAKRAADTSDSRPHTKARATCLMGDLLASGSKADFRQALVFHTKAIQLADPLLADPHPAIRIAAKEVLIDAHLGAAHDIAWGEWKGKSQAVARWLERAMVVANDLSETEGRSEESLFRVYVRALGAYVGVRGGIDPEPAAKAVVEVGQRLIAEAREPGRKARLQNELGTALYDAVQVFQMRSEDEKAFKHGEMAVDCLAEVAAAQSSVSSAFALGRLYFRLGSIQALHYHDHQAAVQWYEKAIPLLERPAPESAIADMGRHGEGFVSMGVSYWEAGRQNEAVKLTQKGIKWMEHAVKQGSLDRSSLAVPYNNLAAMHRKLGANDTADRFQEMASRLKDEKLK